MLRVAVVGAGYWGPNLVRNFSSATNVEVAAVCDVRVARLDEMNRRFRIGRTTTDFDSILADKTIDAVALATPVATHRPLGERALKAGKHLWVEKPLAGTVEDASVLVQTAAQEQRLLFVDHTFVYTPAVRKLRELIVAGELGDVLYFDSVRVNLGLFQSDTNVLWDLAPHDLSIASYILQKEPTCVSAFGVRHFAEAKENMAYVTLGYADSTVAHFHFNWMAPVKIRRTMIGGSKKMIVYDDLETVEKVKVYDKGVNVNFSEDVEARRQTLVSYRTGHVWSPHLDSTEALSQAVGEFSSAIAVGRSCLTDGEAGLAVVRILSAAQKSLEQKGAFVALSDQ